jgi:LmbE family N-acetylglucosaminyl deacetylase
MKQIWGALISIFILTSIEAQTPKTYSSADILQQLKKLEVFGSVLYIAAHPDDENTRLLAYLSNERRFRTGYLSLTRGDGGQNLLGDEQGIDLGLIRTQELLAARRIDGAEQFFSSAYDFGFSKSPVESIQKWGHDKILSEVVWVIRTFKPDVIITRFPTTGEGGHGHHTASAIFAEEAFAAAADASKFPEQLKKGVKVWQAKRLLWNTFNFGGNNTQREDQLKIDVGMYNPIIGKSYGEMAAESRSQHKSQGFGVPAQRGESFEYFATIKGDKPEKDIMDGVDVSSRRMGEVASDRYDALVKKIIGNYNPSMPHQSTPDLESLYEMVQHLKEQDKTELINELMARCAGFFMEATVANPLNVVGDSLKFSVIFNNRLGFPVEMAQVSIYGTTVIFDHLSANINNVKTATVFIPKESITTQPYWLEYPMKEGSFDVREQEKIGVAENIPPLALFQIKMNGNMYNFSRPVQYKYTDPIKGELYQPVQLVNPVFVNTSPSLIIFSNHKKSQKRDIEFALQSNISLKERISFTTQSKGHTNLVFDSLASYGKGEKRLLKLPLNSDSFPDNSTNYIGGQFKAASLYEPQMLSLNKISYDHIPDIYYNYYDRIRILKMDLKTAGRRVGYIAGAGDKVPEALKQMGYEVLMLGEKDMTLANLKPLDAIVTGVRAYNTNVWLSNAYDLLMQYVKEGGVLLVQYNTSNSIGAAKAKIGPYPFTITRNRITDETAGVKFLLPNHPVLNYPNKITQRDFEGWIQERSVYNAENMDSNFQRMISMKDPGEKEQDGSLIIANFGKGRFVYSGLVFFRELPAGVLGAYRLFANLIASPKSPPKKGTSKAAVKTKK